MRKYKLISTLAEETAKEVVRNEESWRRYLNTAFKLYKYPFKEQIFIYAQRPEATACGSIEIWNEKMHCWGNKGAKGIALIDEDSFSGLKYVFDISDVHKARRIGQFPNLWETLSQLGSNVSDLSKPILMEIGKAIGAYDRQIAQNREETRVGREHIDTLEKNIEKGLANASEADYNALKRKPRRTIYHTDRRNRGKEQI